MKGTILNENALRMTPEDNVATALADLQDGMTFETDAGTVTLTTDVPFGHKFALQSIPPEEHVIKYGEIIGEPTEDINPGEWVHTHNCQSTRGRGDRQDSGTPMEDSA